VEIKDKLSNEAKEASKEAAKEDVSEEKVIKKQTFLEKMLGKR